MRYGSAVLVVALATGLRLLLDPVFGDGFPFITFFFAVVFIAWFVGFGPSLAGLLLSCLSAAYFILTALDSIITMDHEGTRRKAGGCANGHYQRSDGNQPAEHRS